MLCYGLNGHMVTAVTVTVFVLIFSRANKIFSVLFITFAKR